MKKLVLILLSVLSLAACTQNKANTANDADSQDDDSWRCTDGPIIHIQPLNGFSKAEAERVVEEFYKHQPYKEEFIIGVQDNVNLDNTLMNNAKTRFRADKILNFLKKNDKHCDAVIALTDKDISVPYRGRADWGVLGLSYRGQNVSVVSTYRLKNPKRDLWKVVLHEFVHAYYNYGHCPKDNPRCIMQDAKGHADFANKKGFCAYCQKHIYDWEWSLIQESQKNLEKKIKNNHGKNL